MHRRHFIKLTGTSLSSLLFTEWGFAQTPPEPIIQLPVRILVSMEDGVHEMFSPDKLVWRYKEVVVQLKRQNNVVSVSVQSPQNALNHIQLVWKYKPASHAKFLGDHWERTYGDVSFEKISIGKKIPWYFIQYDEKSTTCFGVKTGGNTICNWELGNGTMQLTLDTRSGGAGVQLGNRILAAAEIVATKNNSGENIFATARRFCAVMCKAPRLPKQPVYGINDWYFAYGKNSSGLILQHTAMLADLATDTNNRPFSVVDAGWAAYSPLLPGDCCWQDDFGRPNENFRDMAKLANDIIKLGMRPGLWTRPLCAAHNDPSSLLLPSIPGRNNPKNPILDPTIPENIERVKHNISLYRQWGFNLVKHDFSTYDILGRWGFEMKEDITSPGWQFNDNSKTTAEIILQLYQSIREAAGEMYLIGCNTISHLSAGIFELNRIGDDTSGNEWSRTLKMGVNTLAFRGIQHNRFYAADADCVGLTPKVPWPKNKQWMQLLANSGTPLFISAQPDAMGSEQRQFIKKCFITAATNLPLGEPLDWMKTPTPSTWKLNNEIVQFNWS